MPPIIGFVLLVIVIVLWVAVALAMADLNATVNRTGKYADRDDDGPTG